MDGKLKRNIVYYSFGGKKAVALKSQAAQDSSEYYKLPCVHNSADKSWSNLLEGSL